jgi:hypothetical protein
LIDVVIKGELASFGINFGLSLFGLGGMDDDTPQRWNEKIA